MVCKRFWETKRFQPEPVHQLHFTTPSVSVDEVVKFASVEKWKNKEEAVTLYNKVKAQMAATVTKVEKKEKAENVPKPDDAARDYIRDHIITGRPGISERREGHGMKM